MPIGRGFRVTLFEKDAVIGGQFNMAKVSAANALVGRCLDYRIYFGDVCR